MELAFQGIQKDSLGYKLVASMGWKEGHGLGATGSGIKQHIRVKKRRERIGIGLDKSEDVIKRDWEANALRYDGVLKRLSEIRSDTSAAPRTKKQKKMKGIKKGHSGRYLRHERAKLVKSYSEVDLAAILGKNPNESASARFKNSLPDVEPSQPSPTITTEQESTSEGTLERFLWWWSEMFVRAGMLNERTSNVTQPRQYSEQDQTELYTQVQGTATHAKQGLGRKKKSKVGGGVINQGKRTVFEDVAAAASPQLLKGTKKRGKDKKQRRGVV